MKVVINSCYGGFGLSDAGVERCLELGMTLTEYSQGGFANPKADFVKAKGSLIKEQHYYSINNHRNDFRSDSRLVQAVEELGKESWGCFAKLKVIDIPFDGVAGWEVDEYDGMESIKETHSSWS